MKISFLGKKFVLTILVIQIIIFSSLYVNFVCRSEAVKKPVKPDDFKSLKAFDNLIKVTNVFFSFISLIISFFVLIKDIIEIPFRLILFINDLGIMNYFIGSIFEVCMFIITKIFPNFFYLFHIAFMNLWGPIISLITNIIFSFYILIYLAYYVFSFLIFAFDYNIRLLIAKKNLNSELHNNSIDPISFSYLFYINFLNPFFLWNNFNLASILVVYIEFKFFLHSYCLLRKIYHPIKFIATKIYNIFTRKYLDYIYRGSYNSIFKDNYFINESIPPNSCSICLDDFSSENYYTMKYSDIKTKIETLLIYDNSNFTNNLNLIFDNNYKLLKLSCSHYFHGKCITDYIKHNYSTRSTLKCPICRNIL